MITRRFALRPRHLMIAGAVVQSYAEVARAERQSAIARETIVAREGSLRLVEVRVRNRLASRLDAEAAGVLASIRGFV